MSGAKDEGYDAYFDGVADTANPYERGSAAMDRTSWEAGWLEAEEEVMADEDKETFDDDADETESDA